MLLDRVSRIARKGRTHVGKLVRARPHLGHHALGRNREVRGKLASARERMSSRNTFGIALGSPKGRARDRGGSRIGEPAVVIILTFSLRLLDREFGIREDVVEHQHGERGLSAMDPENRGIYTQSDSSKKSSRNIWSLAVVSVDQRY